MDHHELESWRRLGAAVRAARINLGFTSREHFAEGCTISARVLGDIEAGARTNFSQRILDRLQAGLRWPDGTIDSILSDANFDAPSAGVAEDLVFQPAVFDRRPVTVEIGAIERSIRALDGARRGADAKDHHTAESELAQTVIALCWPYVNRLIEDNCRPGLGVHPAVRPYYDAFTRVSGWASPNDPASRYAQWLVGDAPAVDETTRNRYIQRWSAARRARV